MKIAFTSCFSAQEFPQQPVWDDIAGEDPDVLVLLGDSMYLDCSGPYGTDEIAELQAEAFAMHAFGRYKAQLAVPQFRNLLERPRAQRMQAYAIWDDHDFLWDDAYGANVWKNKALRPLVRASHGMFAAFRQALAGQPIPSTLPPWSADNTPAPEPNYQLVELDKHKLYLHLTDGRTARLRKQSLLGQQQFTRLRQAIQKEPDAVHLVASGSVFEKSKGDSWLKAPAEHDALLELAKSHRILLLSGDIHGVNFVQHPGPGGRLFEATASGAAVRTGVVIGSEQRNWGLLDITDSQVAVKIRHFDGVPYDKRIDRQAWALK
jgi:phosphodiesterase/alkaline phosphatase D-like protein